MVITKKYLISYKNKAIEKFKKIENKINLLEYIDRTQIGIPKQDLDYIKDLILNDIEKDLSNKTYDFSKYFEKIDLLSKTEKIKDVDLKKLNL